MYVSGKIVVHYILVHKQWSYNLIIYVQLRNKVLTEGMSKYMDFPQWISIQRGQLSEKEIFYSIKKMNSWPLFFKTSLSALSSSNFISGVPSTHRHALTLALLPLQTPDIKHKGWSNRALLTLGFHYTFWEDLMSSIYRPNQQYTQLSEGWGNVSNLTTGPTEDPWWECKY